MKGKRAKKILLLMGVLGILLIAVLALIPLPDSLDYPESMVSCRIVDRNGVTLREVLSDREGTSCFARLEEISPWLPRATIAAEDKRFYLHRGVDPVAIARAAIQDIKALRIVSGGSTITQQLAEIGCGLPPGTLFSKIRETLYALKIEGRYSKKEILTLYLNRIPYGNQLFGIEAASRGYFDRPARDLTLAQSAFLASIPQSPALYDPYRNFDKTTARQHHILELMRDEHVIDEASYREALAETISLSPLRDKFRAPHFCDLVESTMALEKLRNLRMVRTTLDISLQEEVELMLRERVRSLRDKGVSNGAAIVMDNTTGEILVMVGSVNYWGDQGQVNASLCRRQPGSTLKPFTYALALENGFTAADIIPDLKISLPSDGEDFTPKNYDETFHGPVRLRTALACSYNIPAVRVLQKIGPEFLYERLKSAGFSSLQRSADYYGVGLTLGSGEVTLLELVRAYSMMARGGETLQEKLILQSEDSRGTPVDSGKSMPTERVFSPQSLYIVTDILSDNDARIPAFGRYSALNLPFPCAAKTGTSKGFRDNWTIGYTPRYTTGVWIGNFDATEMKKISGITGSAPLFRDIMRLVHEKEPPGEFARPDGIIEARICPLSGKNPGPWCTDAMDELFREGTLPSVACDIHRKVTVDIRTGMQASDKCPEEFRRNRVYEVYPPLYAEWTNERGIPRPPAGVTYTLKKSESAQSDRTVIIFPRDGDVFRIDPILRRQYQVIHFKAMAPHGTEKITWWIDGKPAAKSKYPFMCEWVMKEGLHTAQAGIDGQAMSRKIQFSIQ